MKNFFKNLLIVILVCTTCIGGFFTYKYFNKQKETNNTPKQEVVSTEIKQTIGSYSDILSTSIQKSPTLVVDKNIEYQDYVGEEVYYAGYNDFLKFVMLQAKIAIQETNVKTNTMYISKGTNASGEQIMKFYFTTKNDDYIYYLYDVKKDSKIYILIDNDYNSAKEWQIKIYSDKDFKLNNNTLSCYTITGNSTNIIGFNYYEFQLADFNFSTADFSVIKVIRFDMFDCNIKAKKILNFSKEQIPTDEKVKEFANIVFADFSKVKMIDFNQPAEENSGFLDLVFNQMNK